MPRYLTNNKPAQHLHEPTRNLVQSMSADEIRYLRQHWCWTDRKLACEKKFGFCLDAATLDWCLAEVDLLFDDEQ